MELLLNSCWLLLGVSAICIWHRQSHSVRRGRSFACLLALSCTLILLFPVISESDDLHAMRQEMEESSAKVKAGESDRSGHFPSRLHAPALATARNEIGPAEVRVGFVEPNSSTYPISTSGFSTRNRAPPGTLL